MLSLKQLICTHWWEEIEIDPNDQPDGEKMNTAVANLYGDFVRCKHCSKETYLSRNEYIQHLIDTKRMKP